MVIATTSTFSCLTRKDVEETRKFIQKERRLIQHMTRDEARRYLVEIKAVKRSDAVRMGWKLTPKKKAKASQ